MSNVQLFVVGTLVTLIVVGSMALPIWGAVLDGRYQHEQEAAEHEVAELGAERSLHVVDAA